MELDGKVLVIRRISVTYNLIAPADKRDVANRVLGFHADFCPVARSLKGAIEISTVLSFEEES